MGMFENALLYVFLVSFHVSQSNRCSSTTLLKEQGRVERAPNEVLQKLQIFFELLYCRVCGLELVKQSQTCHIFTQYSIIAYIFLAQFMDIHVISTQRQDQRPCSHKKHPLYYAGNGILLNCYLISYVLVIIIINLFRSPRSYQ